MTASPDSVLKRFEDALDSPDDPHYDLTLFVSGASDLSARAIANARQVCDSHLAGRYHLAVVNVQDDPHAVVASDVIAVPTLVKTRPLPVRKLVGDLSNTSKVLMALELPAAQEAGSFRS